MNTQNDTGTYVAGTFITENAVRGALERRRQTVPARAGDAEEVSVPSSAGDASRRDRRPRRLRRWSVADLLARAAARPPTGGLAH
jgi:hypothetical protein